MLLHLLGFGSVFDTVLLGLFNLPQESTEVLFPVWAMIGYIGLSIGAIWSKTLFWLVLGLSSLYMIYLFISI